MNRNKIEKAIWWAYIILLFAIVVVKFKGSFAELRDRITLYSSQEAVIFNLIPFRNIGVQIKHITQWWALKNLLGNLLPFVPFGFLLPIAYPRIKAFFKVFLVGMSAVLFIEIFQYMTRLGSFDIDDIILNMVGVLMGYGTFLLVKHVLLKER